MARVEARSPTPAASISLQAVMLKVTDVAPKDPLKVPQEAIGPPEMQLPAYMVNVQKKAHELVLLSMDPVRLCLMDPIFISWY